MDHEHDVIREIPEGLPEIKDPELLWIHGFYDGTLSGMIRVNGEMLWTTAAYECTEDGPAGCGFYRRYLVMRLEPSAVDQQVQQQADFVKYVLGHEEEGWRFSMNRMPPTEQHLYYDKWPDKPDPEGEPVGWFDR